jgi:hypothetical protein
MLHPAAALSQRRSPFFPLDIRLCGPQSGYGRGGEEKYLIPAWKRTSVIHSIPYTELLRLSHVFI